MQVKGVEVHVKEMVYCARCSWGSDIHTECIPPVPARQLHVEDAVKHQLPPSLTLLVEQWRAKMLAREQRHGLVRSVILSVGCQEPEHTLRLLRGNWMSFEHAIGRVWIFQDMRHRLCLPLASSGCAEAAC